MAKLYASSSVLLWWWLVNWNYVFEIKNIQYCFKWKIYFIINISKNYYNEIMWDSILLPPY